QPPRGHRPAAGLDPEPLAVLAQRGDPPGLDPAAVAGHLVAAGRIDLRRRCTIAGEEVVYVAGRGVARVTRVDHQDRAARPGQGDRAAEPGGAAADHHDVIAVIHAPTMTPARKFDKSICRSSNRGWCMTTQCSARS